MISLITGLLGNFLPFLLGFGVLITGWFVNNKVQQKKGRKQERQEAKEFDHEMATEIRDRVNRDRAQLVRDLDDAGWRD